MSPSSRWPQLLADENIRAKLVRRLSQIGCDIRFAKKGLKNAQLIALAKKQKRVLLTNDKDFLEESIYPPEKYEGIVVLAIHPPKLSKQFLAVRQLLTTFSKNEFAGRSFVLSEFGVEVRGKKLQH